MSRLSILETAMQAFEETQREIVRLSDEMIRIENAQKSGDLLPVHASDQRETALIKGVMAVARYFGVSLKPICAIDSRGELSLATVSENPMHRAGDPFSDSFCDVLNRHAVTRCSVNQRAMMDPAHSNWCKINHFDAERMVHAVADSIKQLT